MGVALHAYARRSTATIDCLLLLYTKLKDCQIRGKLTNLSGFVMLFIGRQRGLEISGASSATGLATALQLLKSVSMHLNSVASAVAFLFSDRMDTRNFRRHRGDTL